MDVTLQELAGELLQSVARNSGEWKLPWQCQCNHRGCIRGGLATEVNNGGYIEPTEGDKGWM